MAIPPGSIHIRDAEHSATVNPKGPSSEVGIQLDMLRLELQRVADAADALYQHLEKAGAFLEGQAEPERGTKPKPVPACSKLGMQIEALTSTAANTGQLLADMRTHLAI